LDARLTTMLCGKKNNDAKYKDVKTGSIRAEFSKDGCGAESAVLPMMMMMINSRNNSNFSLI
jgi:hypothetical protein